MTCRTEDENGELVQAGDWIRFSYGIPPVCVEARIIERDGRLIALTPGHNPAESSLRSLKNHVGFFTKISGRDEDKIL